jgi:chemotaxis protein histidine kinase CheA
MNLRRSYLTEVDECLGVMNTSILKLEKDPLDNETLHDLFRAAHTLKGSANLYGYSGVAIITHLLETIFDELRDGAKQLESSLTDLLLECFDQLRRLVQLIADGLEDPQCEGDLLQRLSQAAKPNIGNQLEAPEFVGAAHIHQWISSLQEQLREDTVWDHAELRWFLKPSMSVGATIVKAADKSKLKRLSSIRKQAKELRELEVISGEVISTMSELQDRLTEFYMKLNGSPLAQSVLRSLLMVLVLLEHYLQSYLIREQSPPDWWKDLWDQWDGAIQALIEGSPQTDYSDLALDVWELCSRTVEKTEFGVLLSPPIAEELLLAGEEEETLTSAEWMLAHSIQHNKQIDPHLPSKLLVEQIQYLAPRGSALLERWELAGRILANCARYLGDHELLALTKQQVPNMTQLKLKAQIFVQDEHPDAEREVSELRMDKHMHGEEPAAAEHLKKVNRSDSIAEADKIIRIEQGKIDQLMKLVSELVIAKNSIPYMIRQLNETYQIPQAAKELKEKYGMLDRISKELQDAILDVRMLAISSVFTKFNRFVRDLARQYDKQIRLEITGEDTTLDKALVEALSEPLLHLIRNAIDHGLEHSEERARSGKTPEGLLKLHAWRDGNRVHVEVSDDGRGINLEKVKQQVLKLGLASVAEVSMMKEEELIPYIFHPGFTTSEGVTALSGRGVGMDAVLSSIRSLQGQVQVSSTYGSGTCVRLELPLTLVMTQVLQVAVGHHKYGVPLDQIQETVRIKQEHIQKVQGQSVISLRNHLFPIVSLQQHLGLTAAAEDHEFLYVVLLKNGMGVQVDTLVGQQEVVVKPLEQGLRHHPYLIGASILGDGTVLLILNGNNISIREG